MRCFAVIIALAALPAGAAAQWGGRACGPVGPLLSLPVAAPQSQPAHAWKPFPDESGWYGLMAGAAQVGVLSPAGEYRPILDYGGRLFGEPCEPPVARPMNVVAAQEPNFGVDKSKLGREPAYWHNGWRVTRTEALALVGKGTLADDSKLPTLTLVGTDADRKKLLASLAASPEWVKLRPLIRLTGANGEGYPADAWQVARHGPGTWLQAPDGKVMYKSADLATGGLLDALRKLHPDWKPPAPPVVPPKTPDQPAPGPKVDPQPAPAAPDNTIVLIVAVVAGVLGLLNLIAHLRRPPE